MTSWRRRLGLTLLVVVTLALAAFAMLLILLHMRPLESERLRAPAFSGVVPSPMEENA